MSWITPAYLEKWGKAAWVGADAPHQVVQVRRGNFRRAYRAWSPVLNVYIPGETRELPWYPIFTETTAWHDIPGINSVELSQSTDQNGMTVASIQMDNVWYEEAEGEAGTYHRIVPGYFAPYRGETPSTRPASALTPNDWARILTKNADIRVWQGFGPPELNEDGSMPEDGGTNGSWTFHGLIDQVDTDSSPVTAAVTARAGKTLTDQRVFGWNKSKQLLDPIIFAPRGSKTESEALAGKLILVDDISDMVRCALRWAGITEWEVEDTGVHLKDRVTFNRSNFLIDIITSAQTYTGFTFFLADPTVGDSLGVGIFRRSSALVRGGSAGVPTRRYDNEVDHAIPDDDPAGVNVVFTSGRHEIVQGVKVSFYITHTYDSDLEIYLTSPQGTTVLIVDGAGHSGDNFGTGNSDVNRTHLEDAGTTLIDAGTAPFVGTYRPSNPLSEFAGEDIFGNWTMKVVDAAGGDIGTVHTASLFLTTETPYIAAASVALEVTDADLLTGLRVTEDEKPLAYIIRVRGKELAGRDGGLTLGGDRIARVMAVYRPPWTDEHLDFFGESIDGEMGGLIKHATMSRQEFTTYDDCLMGCYLIAVSEALAAVTGTLEMPGMPYLELDDQIGVMDDNTGTNQRLLITNRTSTFTDGEDLNWTTSLGGSMIDNHYLFAVLQEILATDFGDAQQITVTTATRAPRLR